MKRETRIRARAARAARGPCLALALVAAVWTGEAAPLAGQAGSETLSRAQSPQQPFKPRQAEAEAPEAAAPKANPKDAIAIGEIAALTFDGDGDFVRAQGLDEVLAKDLCDGSVKTVGDLKKAFAHAKGVLAGRGFSAVYVYPSASDAYHADTKTLDLTVDPARYGNVSVTRAEGAGNWYSDESILRRFRRVKPGEPFNYLVLRQAIRSVNGHPDLMADTRLSVRTETNATVRAREGQVVPPVRLVDAALSVDDGFPLHATLELNNHAMPELKYWQMLLSVQYLNLTGADDMLTLSPGVTMNGDQWSVAASYLRPFDALLGGSWSVYGGYSDMDCDGIQRQLDLEGIGGFAGLNTSWNLWDTEARNVAFTLGVMWRLLLDQWEAQATSLSRRDLQIVPLTFGFSYGDRRRDWLGGLSFASVSQTLNLYGDHAKFDEYSEDATPEYAILRASWSRLQPLLGPKTDGEEWRCWALFGRVEGQWSEDTTLISSERLAYGGYSCLRGYRSRGYLGDNGVYGTAEFRTPVWCNPVSRWLVPEDWTSVVERIQLAAFTDAGWIAFNTTTTSGMDREEFLWSAGFGVRMALTKYLSANFDCAFPLIDGYGSDEDRDVEVYLSVKLQY